MKKTALFFAILSLGTLSFSACNSSGTTATNTTAAATATTPAVDINAIKKGELKKVTGKEVNQKFGIDYLSEKVFYNVSYEYKTSGDGKEIYHGKFSIKTAEDAEGYIARLLPKDEDPSGEVGFNLRFDFSDDTVDGQFADGKKDGKITFKINGHESGCEGFIIFDAKTGGATTAKYSGAAGGGSCYNYEGAVKLGTFKELISLTIESDC